MTHDAQKTVLSPDPARAARELIGILSSLGNMLDEEANALASGDAIGFVALQEAKERASLTYQHAAKEFRARLGEFRRVEKKLIAELDAAQRDFGDRARTNLAILDKNRGAIVRRQGQMMEAAE